MTVEIAIFLALLLAAVVLFSFEWIPADVTALGLMLALILSGLLDPATAFAGFGSETVLMILGLLIIMEALVSAGATDLSGRWLLSVVGESAMRLRLLMLVAPAAMSALMSNTASAAFFTPLALGLATRARVNASKLLMPLAFATILAGSTTLIGSSTNLVVSGLMQQHGLPPLGMFELTPIGLPVLLVGLLYMALLGWRLIPERDAAMGEHAPFDSDLYFTELTIPPSSPLAGKTLEETLLREEWGLGLLQLRRGNRILQPLADMRLTAGDTLLVEGRRGDILRLPQRPEVELNGKIEELEGLVKDREARIAEVVLLPGSPLVGRTLQGLGLRGRYRAQILAAHRAGATRHHRIGRMVFHLGDLLLILASEENLRLMEQERLFRVVDRIETRPQDPRRALLVGAIFGGALLLAALGVLPLPVAALLAALLIFLSGSITPQLAYRNIEWKMIILVGSMLAFGRAMQESGAADFLAEWIIRLSASDSPLLLLSLFFWLAVLLTQPMSNQAAAAVLMPIALQTASLLGYDPRPFAITIALAASASFIAPLEPASVIVYSAGRYRFIDFIRVGGPLTLLVYGVVMALGSLLWQF